MLDRIATGRTDLVFEVVAAGCPSTATDDRGVSLIEWCAYYGDVSAIRFLLSQGARLESLGANLDLNGAAFHGHWRLCQFLIERGANVNDALPDTAETPLHAALSQRHRPAHNLVVEVLLANGADPNRVTVAGAATGSFMRDCRTQGESPLHRAAAYGDEDVIRLLLDAGATLDAKDVNGDTPLTWASRHLRPAYILRMLCYGEFSISEEASMRSRRDARSGWDYGMGVSLLGTPELKAAASHRSKSE